VTLPAQLCQLEAVLVKDISQRLHYWRFWMESSRRHKQVTVLIGLDLSAAFDTVDHRLLLDRLQLEFGVTAAVLSRRPDPVYQGGPARITRH